MRKKWEEFEKKHEKIAKLLIQLLYFWVFSMGWTRIYVASDSDACIWNRL